MSLGSDGGAGGGGGGADVGDGGGTGRKLRWSSALEAVSRDLDSSDRAALLIRAGYDARMHPEERGPGHGGIGGRSHHELRVGDVGNVR